MSPLLLSLFLLAPVATGTVPEEIVVIYLIVAALLVGLALWPLRGSRRARVRRGLLVAASLCFSLVVADTLARVLLNSVLYYRPDEMFLKRYPRMPLISRFTANASYIGRTYGDLAAAGAFKRHREFREMRFATDSFGFPNEPRPSGAGSRGIDLILLGDSYGAGSGTSQDKTWAHLFHARYGFEVYNLSMPTADPWHEYITLATEIDRLRVKKGALVVWAIFTGNDLDEDYYPSLELRQLPWMDPVGVLGVSARTFQNRSPIRQIFTRFRKARLNRDRVVEREFVDGRTMLFFSTYVRHKDRSLEEIEHHEHFRDLQAVVAAMASLARARALRVTVVLIPSKEEVYSWVVDRGPPWSASAAPSGFSVALREISERNGLAFLDLKPFLIDASERLFRESRAVLWWYDDTHWNDRGQAVAASAVYEHLTSAGRSGPSPSR